MSHVEDLRDAATVAAAFGRVVREYALALAERIEVAAGVIDPAMPADLVLRRLAAALRDDAAGDAA